MLHKLVHSRSFIDGEFTRSRSASHGHRAQRDQASELKATRYGVGFALGKQQGLKIIASHSVQAVAARQPGSRVDAAAPEHFPALGEAQCTAACCDTRPLALRGRRTSAARSLAGRY